MQRHPGPFELILELGRIVVNVLSWRRAAALGAVLCAGMVMVTALSAETVTFTVEDKSMVSRWGKLGRMVERELPYSDPRTSDVLVIETVNEILEVSWSFVFLKFDKYDRWNSLRPGATYRAVVTGWNMPQLGQYRNIVEVIDQLEADS